MSERRQQAVYDAIADEIMDLRIRTSRNDVEGHPITAHEMDHELFALELTIWSCVSDVLGLVARSEEKKPKEGER